MASFKITDLTELAGGSVNDSDVFEIVDLDADQSKKVTIASLKTVFAGDSGLSEGDPYTSGTNQGFLYNNNGSIETDKMSWNVDGLKVDRIYSGVFRDPVYSNGWFSYSSASASTSNVTMGNATVQTFKVSLRSNGTFGTYTTQEQSSILQFDSTSKGVLIPRMNTAQRNAISSPANGLLIYNTTDNQFQYYNGGLTSWAAV